MLQLKNITKTYTMGENTVHALQGINLNIDQGDFVAIMGPSGSGKSTLAQILGLLDVPSSGSYQLNQREIAQLSEDELSVLRRDEIGFIFQQFNLLNRMSTLENVALPLLYSKKAYGEAYAKDLLTRVGLGTRLDHRPNQLSGGQQQRVAIARSLINKPRMILADEPTGNLDSKSEQEIMAILNELNQQGITVIMVTHEEEIGQKAKRLIRMRDGKIQSDERLAPLPHTPEIHDQKSSAISPTFKWHDLIEHFHQGFKTLLGNKLRTGLSLLGILIGVASVVAMMALGTGAQKAIENQLASLGSNLLVLRPGGFRVGGVSQESGTVTRLTIEDAEEIRRKIPLVKQASSNLNGRGQVTYLNKNWNTQVQGTSPSYPSMRASVPEVGRFFNQDEDQHRARVAVIGQTIVRELFGEQNPLGEMIKINKVNFQVLGVLPEKGSNGWRDQDDVILIPVTTAMHRLFGKDYIDSLDLEIRDPGELEQAQEEILSFIYARKKVPFSQREEAFQIRNMADIQSAMAESSKTMSMLLATIAAISLLVGGIGIMNIMLVSVTERTKEIGLRKAIGARRFDILMQFLVESLVVSLMGGLLGLIVGQAITEILTIFTGWNTSISLSSVLVPFVFSGLIGMIFGLYPARKASLLQPIEALRYE